MINYKKWTKTNLKQTKIIIRSAEVSIWRTRRSAKRPTILLVHGITGDRFGLVPLIEALSKDYNCLLLELPGHGLSQRIPLRDSVDLQSWFKEVYLAIEPNIGPIAGVVAHSFGCTAVVGDSTRSSKTVLLNPVPYPSAVYAQYARAIMGFSTFWALFYNVRLFIWLRSRALAKVTSRGARRRISYVSRYSRPRYRQIIYQSGLVDIILDRSSYSHIQDSVDLIVCGLEDTTAHQRDSLELAGVFGSSPIEFLRGGHLLPIESPERIAYLIRQVV